MLVSGSVVFCPAVPLDPIQVELEVWELPWHFTSHPVTVCEKNAIRSYMPSEVEFQPPLRNPSVLSIRLDIHSEGFGNEKLTR